MLHFGHVILLVEVIPSVLVLDGVVIGARTISSRSGTGRRDTYWLVVAEAHTTDDIDPNEPSNMDCLLALERTQASPHSACLKDVAC